MSLEIVDKGDTPRGCLESLIERSDDLDGVMVLALKNNGNQLLETSRMNMEQKAFLLAFAQSWLSRWFYSQSD